MAPGRCVTRPRLSHTSTLTPLGMCQFGLAVPRVYRWYSNRGSKSPGERYCCSGLPCLSVRGQNVGIPRVTDVEGSQPRKALREVESYTAKPHYWRSR